MTQPTLRTEVDGWLGRLAQIPRSARRFDVDAQRATAEFGIDEALAGELTARGLPHEDGEAGRRFAEVDLHYLALRLGLASSYITAMRLWAKALAGSAGRISVKLGIRYVAYVPPGTEVEALAPGRVVPAVTGADRTALRIDVEVRCKRASFDPEVHAVLEDAGALDFCLLPAALELDAEFVRGTRLASCASAAQMIVGDCTARGIEARPAFGLLLGRPFATPHNWAEIRVGNEWAPVDPLLLAAMRDYAGLDGTAWPVTCSPGAILLRVADARASFVTARTEPVRATFVVSDAG